MMKLSTANLNKIIEKCTKKEINMMVYFSQIQDENGVVRGVRYDECMKQADVKKSTFFALLKSLEVKGIISVSDVNEPSFWTVTILDNVFQTQEDYKKGYMNMNRDIFYTSAFKAMTKGEKVVVFNLIKIADFSDKMIKITYKRIAEWTGKSMRSVRSFVKTLSTVFRVIKKDNQCLVDCLVVLASSRTSESDVKNSHLINYRLLKAKCQAKKSEIADVCKMMKQFASYGYEKLIGAIDKSLNSLGTLAPAFINCAIRL